MKQEHVNNKHLTYEEREYIEIRLGQGKSFAEIGKDINKYRTIITREVQNRKYKKVPSKFNNSDEELYVRTKQIIQAYKSRYYTKQHNRYYYK